MLAAARRSIARAARLAVRTFARQIEAASGTRWPRTPPFGRYAGETAAGAPMARGRARHLVVNDPLAGNAAAIYRTGLVGAGIVARSGHPDPTVRRRLDAEFAAWADENAWPAFQADVVHVLPVDGEALVVMRTGDRGLELQHVPAEQLDDSMTANLDDGRYVVNGVEFNGAGRRIAYHIHRAKPTDLLANYAPPARVDAADVLHIYRPLGPGAVRGLTWYAPVVLSVNELNQLCDALLMNSKIAAMHAAFLVDQNGTATHPFPDGKQAEDAFNVSLEPGTVRYLPPGWDVRFSNPAQMLQAIEFAQLSIRLIAAGLQIPEFLLSGDMRGANYSSMRSALVSFRQHLDQIQHTLLVPQFLAPVWRRWVTLAVLNGEIFAPDFEARQRDYFAVEFYPPSPPWIDPAKDAEAFERLIASGMMSRRQAVAERGYDVEDVDREIAADREREKRLGLTFNANDPEPTNDASQAES